MNVRCSILYLLISVGATSMALAAIERTVEKNFPASPSAVLKIDACQGVIRIEPSADNLIHVLVRETMDVRDEAAADRRLQELELQIQSTDTLVSVKARYRRTTRWAWEGWPPVALSFLVKVPKPCGLDLATAEGDITVCSMSGAVKLQTDNGAIFAGEIAGSVRASCLRGDVSVTACSGELIIIAKSGNVLVGRANGSTKIAGSGGLIEVQNSRGTLRIDADGADIKVGLAHPLVEKADLRSAGGDIEVDFDRRDACTLSAFASIFGQVRTRNLPLKIESGKIGSPRAIGTLNGGGPAIFAEANGGNVLLVGREP